MESSKSPISKFAFYVREGVHYFGEDLKIAMVTIFGQGRQSPELPVIPPEELMQRIEQLQQALKDQQIESGEFEQQLRSLKQLVTISQQQQQKIASELSKLSDVLHRS